MEDYRSVRDDQLGLRGLLLGVFDGVGLLTDGSGQFMSAEYSSQYGLIFSYRYHCLSAESPFGVMTGGRSVATGCHDNLFLRDRKSVVRERVYVLV